MKTIGQLNAAIYRNMQILIGRRLSNLDIRTGEYDFFLVISNIEGMSQKELSEHLQIGKSTTAKAVKNLIKKGYVYKEKDKVDGRVDHLYMTDLGRKEAPTVRKMFQKNLDVAGRYLSKTEEKQLLFLMNKVLDSLTEEKTSKEKE